MPGPAIIGIPALMAFLGALIVKIIDFFSGEAARRILIVAVYITGMGAAFAVAWNKIYTAISTSSFNWSVMNDVLMFIPSDAPLILSTYIGARTSLFLYHRAMDLLDAKTRG